MTVVISCGRECLPFGVGGLEGVGLGLGTADSLSS